MRGDLLLLLLTFIIGLQQAGGLEVLDPAEGAAAPLSSSGVLRLRIDLGEGVRVPTHGSLAVFVDGDLSAVLCPQQETSFAGCPGAGEALDGRVSVALEGVRGGERFISVELLDAQQNPVLVARRTVVVTGDSELDESFPSIDGRAPAFTAVVFSKDRACQLDQLLASLSAHVPNLSAAFRVKVLYLATTGKFADGYASVKRLHPNVAFHQQHNLSDTTTSSYYEEFIAGGGDPVGFKADFLRLLDPEVPYTLHFMDDMVVTRPFGLAEQITVHRTLQSRPDVIAFSLRLHPQITTCYATESKSDAPLFDPEMTWNWQHAQGDFAYPMSLDAHIFHSSHIASLVLPLPRIENPNLLEGALAVFCYGKDNPDCPPRLACFQEARVINIPANRVQSVFPNRFMEGGPSAELLNTEFLFNRRLISDHLWHQTFDSVHVPEPLVFGVGSLQGDFAPPRPIE